MQTLGEGLSSKRGLGNNPSFLESIGLLEKIPASLTFGAILGLSSPGFEQTWLAWIGLVPLLILSRSSGSAFNACLLGLSFGLAYNMVCLRWIWGLYPLTVFQIHDSLSIILVALVWLLESLHQAILIAIFSTFAYALPTRAGFLPFYTRPFFPYLLTLPLLWVFLHWTIAPSEPFLGIPINQLSYSQYSFLPIMQICSFGGAQLLDLLIVMINLALAAALFEFLPKIVKPLPERVDTLSDKGGAIFDLVVVVSLLGLINIWGESRLKKVAEFPPCLVNSANKKLFAPSVPIAVLQGNIPVRPQAIEVFSKNERQERYLSLAKNLGVSMFILPEAVLRLEEPEGKLFYTRLAGVCRFEKKESLVGSFEFLKSGLVNLVRLIDCGGNSEIVYIKTRLLPFVESIPFRTLASVLPENLLSLLPSSKNNMLVSPMPFLLKSIWGNVGASVSFELVYPELIAQEVNKGASLLVNVGDISWFHRSSLGKQLLAVAVARAVENGRYLVIASNSGISAVINPLGVVTSCTNIGQEGNLIDRVQFLSTKTNFTRMWWLWRPSYRIWWH